MYANHAKYMRAKAACGPDATEEEVKTAYIALGGLVIEEPAEEVVDAPKKKKK